MLTGSCLTVLIGLGMFMPIHCFIIGWLTFKMRIQFEILLLTFKVLGGNLGLRRWQELTDVYTPICLCLSTMTFCCQVSHNFPAVLHITIDLQIWIKLGNCYPIPARRSCWSSSWISTYLVFLLHLMAFSSFHTATWIWAVEQDHEGDWEHPIKDNWKQLPKSQRSFIFVNINDCYTFEMSLGRNTRKAGYTWSEGAFCATQHWTWQSVTTKKVFVLGLEVLTMF